MRTKRLMKHLRWKSRKGERDARKRREERAMTTDPRRGTTPVHPRERYYYAVGQLHATLSSAAAVPEFRLLAPPTHGGGSYFARYRAMYEAGYAAARKAAA